MLLVTKNLTKAYGDFLALDDLSLEVGRGEVFGLLGPNGSGKSTTIRLLLGFLQPTRGHAIIGGHDCWHDSVAVRSQVAYLPGELRLYENMTGRQLLRFLGALRRHGMGERAETLAKRFDIDLNRPIAHLSSGMKRKLALIQVLMPQVPLLILDEPTNTLDPTMRDELLEQLIEAKQRGQTVLFSSHVLQEVERVCDRVGILRKGRLAHLQEMKELQSSRQVRFRLQAGVPMAWPELPGVRMVGSPNGEVTLECRGELQPLLSWLANHAIADLRIEPLGLGPVYHQYYGSEA